MFEYQLARPKALPGSRLLFGNSDLGYYGRIEASAFITGDSLAQKIGITTGTAQFSNDGWLKFAYQGKTIYIAKKPFRYAVTWKDIYLVGAAYGDDTNGVSVDTTLRLQNARVTIGNKQYRVRLLRALSTTSFAYGREMTDLLRKVATITAGPWDALSSADLGYSPAGSSYNLRMWGVDPQPSFPHTRILIPENLTTLVFGDGITNNSITTAWRPVLELV
jgi:hypothetical protein